MGVGVDMKRLKLAILLPTYLCAINYDIDRYYHLEEYVSYELQTAHSFGVPVILHMDGGDRVSPYDASQNSIFISPAAQSQSVSNINIGGGVFVTCFAVMRLMDWWIKQNRRVQRFVATYSAWTREQYAHLFEGSLPNEKIFTLYHHYQFRGFREYIKIRPGYEQEILHLLAALERKDKTLRKAIKRMPGCSTAQFATLIHAMADDIHRARAAHAQCKQKEHVMNARRVIAQQIKGVFNRELKHILKDPYTWRVIRALTEYIESEITSDCVAENGETLALLDACSTGTVV